MYDPSPVLAANGRYPPTAATIRHGRARGRNCSFASIEQRVATYATEGESSRADKPRVWSETRFLPRPRQRPFDLHPDGLRLAVAPVPEQERASGRASAVLIASFFDELRRLAPVP